MTFFILYEQKIEATLCLAEITVRATDKFDKKSGWKKSARIIGRTHGYLSDSHTSTDERKYTRWKRRRGKERGGGKGGRERERERASLLLSRPLILLCAQASAQTVFQRISA